MISFRFEYVEGVPCPIIEASDPDDALVLSAYLREAWSFSDDMLNLLDEAQQSPSQALSFGGNEIFLDAHQGSVVITAQWIKDPSGNELSVEVPLMEAKDLLVRWRKTLGLSPQSP